MAKLVTFDQFKGTNMKGSEPIPQEIKTAKETIKYNDIKLSYNYGTSTDPIIQDVYVELPEVQASNFKYAIEPAIGKNGPYEKITSSMMITFDLVTPETRSDNEIALQKMDELHLAASQCIGACKGKLKMHDFDPLKPGSAFQSPVYWHRDEVSGEKVKGKNPTLWVNLKPYKNNRTLFTDLNGQEIDWKLFKDVNITFLPLLHVEKIFIGAKVKLKIHLQSAIILKIVPSGSESRQVSTMERLKLKYGGGKVDEVEAQLAELRMTRQETLNTTPLPSSHTDFGSDYSNDPSNDNATMHNIPKTNEASLQDFLSGAPAMSSSSFQTSNPTQAANTTQSTTRTITMKIN